MIEPKYSIKLIASNYVQYHKEKGLHCCDWDNNCFSAVEWCHEDEDHILWTGNSEYRSVVNFCPHCGFKSTTQRIA